MKERSGSEKNDAGCSRNMNASQSTLTVTGVLRPAQWKRSFHLETTAVQCFQEEILKGSRYLGIVHSADITCVHLAKNRSPESRPLSRSVHRTVEGGDGHGEHIAPPALPRPTRRQTRKFIPQDYKAEVRTIASTRFDSHRNVTLKAIKGNFK